MPLKIAINGFGRIGRAAFKIILDNNYNVEIAAINDLTDNETLAHLLKYDTVYGVYDKKVKATAKGISAAGKEYKILAERNPGNLPWKTMGIDVVLECTGFFTKKEDAGKHIAAGAKKVIISAPSKSDDIGTYVLGVNAEKISKNEKIISNASCTTNSIAPVMKVLEAHFGIQKALMTTIHSYTADQNLVDGPHKDLRRARAAAQNIVPTTTGAAKAAAKTIPSLKDKFDGIAVRVPTPAGSLSDITALLRKNTAVENINKVFLDAAKKKELKNILAAAYDPIVSSDVIKNPYSTIVDLSMTKVVDGNLVKIIAWYDNEWGYASRLVELAIKFGK
ncbi:type I glyceraldehyde-3-phosphate dehydrogenase [Candidatus Falkowbacteria bacterium RBG_13_39_14]|uniref:Glyceraldehyde-3-phosphate dehydrogenase n=1 Tax=Candidatus Falkowbacteria bacterium RBG_13_39_14 TaxID=1797985 RepID=A0A1F5S529_9BACT|nr:MAG: type I glyceraldehyde-3-phosphate dehydrogenase [Candidatus Falkowbacteria bacterium RBG_13_39_14]